MSRHTSRVLKTIALGWLGAAGLVCGCDSTPETPPMDEPIDQRTAMEADERMQQNRRDLLREKQQEVPEE